MNYQAVIQGATTGITDTSQTRSASGVISIPIVWNVWGTGKKSRGIFTVQLENRHILGNYTISPQNLAFETGSILPTATKFGQATLRILVMHYAHVINDRFAVVVGQIAPDDYFSHHALMHPFLNFWNFGSIISPAGNWVNPGFGVAVGAALSENISLKADITDAEGDPFEDHVFLYGSDQFWKGNFNKNVELLWVASYDQRYFKRVSISAYHTDAFAASTGNSFEAAYGVNFASNWSFGQKWVPFLLAGISNGKGVNTLAEETVTIGLGYSISSHNTAAVSANWVNPPGGLRDQYLIETFVRYYVTDKIAVTPNLQWVYHPALNAEVESMAYWGVRGRVDI
jgi:porin